MMLIVGAVLALAILFLVFRASNLVGIIKGDIPSWDTKSNGMNAIFMIVFVVLFIGGFWWYFFFAQGDLLPESASIHGKETDSLFNVATVIILIPFVVLNILLFWAAYRFRYNKNRRSNFSPHNNKLEMAWTIIPAIVFAILILRGVPLWDKLKSKAPDESEVVEIMGFQFGWKVRYPGKDKALGGHHNQMIDGSNEFGIDLADNASYDDFITNEIHVPKGKPVLLKIWSRDVIHSVFAPHFRLKQDAVPGMGTSFWFEPSTSTQEMRDKLGRPDFNYEIACTEVCGRGHFAMRMILVVDEPDEFTRWTKTQTAWLKENPDYLLRVPEKQKDVARIKSGMEELKLKATL